MWTSENTHKQITYLSLCTRLARHLTLFVRNKILSLGSIFLENCIKVPNVSDVDSVNSATSYRTWFFHLIYKTILLVSPSGQMWLEIEIEANCIRWRTWLRIRLIKDVDFLIVLLLQSRFVFRIPMLHVLNKFLYSRLTQSISMGLKKISSLISDIVICPTTSITQVQVHQFAKYKIRRRWYRIMMHTKNAFIAYRQFFSAFFTWSRLRGVQTSAIITSLSSKQFYAFVNSTILII